MDGIGHHINFNQQMYRCDVSLSIVWGHQHNIVIYLYDDYNVMSHKNHPPLHAALVNVMISKLDRRTFSLMEYYG
jgi:hypothetical protein